MAGSMPAWLDSSATRTVTFLFTDIEGSTQRWESDAAAMREALAVATTTMDRTQTRTGICPAHGQVKATREIPGLTFPFFVYGWRRYKARGRPFHCPTCGAETTMR